MFDYPYLETLRAVEKEGTYERAAQALGITRSAISQKISLLEDRWRTTTTTRNPVSVTKHGSRLCRHLDQVQLLEAKLVFNAGHLFDTSEIQPHAIKLLFDTDLLPTGFLDNLILFVDSQNDFEFEIIRATLQTIQSQTNSDSVAAAISSNWTQSANFQIHSLGTQPFIAVAHPEFAEEYFAEGLSPSAFRGVPCVTYGGTSDISEQFLAQAFGCFIETRATRLHSNSGVLKACLKQKGWAVLPPAYLHDYLENGSLVELMPDNRLSIDLYFYVSRFISELLPEVANTVLAAAENNLQSAP